MATLSSALNYALAGLSVSAAQSALTARNVSSAGDENYTRKTAEIRTLPGGAPAVAGIGRSTDRQLLDKLLQSTSDSAGKEVVLDALGRMAALSADPADDQSVAAAIGKLQQALRTHEANPANLALAQGAVTAADALARKLNDASAALQALRSEADAGLAGSAERINTLLAQFKVANDAIVRGQGTAGELAESLDRRDAILKHLSEEIGIRTTVRANNDMVIHAEGGAVLFEGSARSVGVASQGTLAPGEDGGALLIDGVAVTGSNAPMPASSGRAAAYATLRDRLAPQMSRQFDMIAAGLIRAFSERDQGAPPTLPDAEGLFLGTGTIPSTTAPQAGLAGRIRLNPLAEATAGGTPMRLRDGGFGGPSFIYNRAGLSGFQTRIAALGDALDQAQGFGEAAGIGGTVSVKALSTQSSAWVEGQRQAARSALDVAAANQTRASDSLLQVTGVNIDQEMAKLLDLEKSYQASSKVLAIVDAMLSTLMEAVRS